MQRTTVRRAAAAQLHVSGRGDVSSLTPLLVQHASLKGLALDTFTLTPAAFEALIDAAVEIGLEMLILDHVEAEPTHRFMALRPLPKGNGRAAAGRRRRPARRRRRSQAPAEGSWRARDTTKVLQYPNFCFSALRAECRLAEGLPKACRRPTEGLPKAQAGQC